MSLQDIKAEGQPEFNITNASTLSHLLSVAIACAVIWGLIIATVGS